MGEVKKEEQIKREADLPERDLLPEKARGEPGWNRWWTLATITAAGSITALILEFLGVFGDVGVILGLAGITLTLLFGLRGVVSSLDYGRSFEVLARNQAETRSIFWDIRDSLRE